MSSLNVVIRGAVLLALALTSFIVAESPAWADSRSVAFVTSSALQSACNGVGGYFSSNASGHSYSCVNGGNAVICSDYKHKICAGITPRIAPKSVLGLPVIPTTAAAKGATIPCDPVFCKIFCGGKPYCTFGTASVQVIHPESGPPASLSTPLHGGVLPKPKPKGPPTAAGVP